MDEIWINYCGMLVYFGLKDFHIVTGLRCDHPKEPLIKETSYKRSKASRTAKPRPSNKGMALSQRPPTKTNKCKEKIDGLLDIAGYGLGNLKPFLSSESRSRITQMTFLIQGSLGDLGTSSMGVASGVVDVGGRDADVDAAAIHDNEHVDAQGKINMFENAPFTAPSHPYTGLYHPYTSHSHPFSLLCSYCKCEECKDR
ncbi:hypothetical protein FXO38_25836 [Capsicum annuum]|nr:hypothetical protein FXO38_25836 [Capsicum annuum]